MADKFLLSGSYNVAPLTGAPSLDPSVDAAIDEQLSLKAKTLVDLLLTSDAPLAVPFGTVANAHVLVVKGTSKVKVTVTSADGTAQSLPADTVLILMSGSVPVTAVTLTRVPATDTTVRVFLGEKA